MCCQEKYYLLNSNSLYRVHMTEDVNKSCFRRSKTWTQNWPWRLIKKKLTSKIMEVAGCKYLRNSCWRFSKFLEKLPGESLVQLKTWLLELFWRWTLPLSFIQDLAKPFEQVLGGKRICLNIWQGTTIFNNMIRFTFLWVQSDY